MAAHVRNFLVSGKDENGEVQYIRTPITAPDREAAERYVGDKYHLTDCIAWDVSNGH